MLFQIKSYIKYLFRSKGKYYLHSPFVYQLVSEVIYSEEKPSNGDQIETLRAELLKDETQIEQEDLGAENSINKRFRWRKVSEMTKVMSTTPKFGKLFYRLGKEFKAENAIELGTAMGIGSLYLKSGLGENGRLITIEGCPNTSNKAKNNFSKLNEKIETINGDFQHHLQDALESIPKLDLIYIDGHHQKKPTLKYFEQSLSKAHNDTCFIFDDIYWSKGMAEAWESIKQHPKVTVTIDLYRVGLVFIREEQAKENFTIRF